QDPGHYSCGRWGIDRRERGGAERRAGELDRGGHTCAHFAEKRQRSASRGVVGGGGVSAMSDAKLAIVVIGRNEGDRLVACLDSIRAVSDMPEPYELIYVDSNSTDGSP